MDTEEALMKPLYKCHLSDGFYFRQNHVIVTGHVIILIMWLWHTERKHFHHSFATYLFVMLQICRV